MSILAQLPKPVPRRTSCGYCHNYTSYNESSCSFAQVPCKDYQIMLDKDKGWRRSDTYYYKSDLKRSCCPPYTIRLDALQFKPSRSQRKLISRFNRWVIQGDDHPGDESKQKGRNNQPVPLEGAIHAAEYDHCTATRACEPAHKFEVTLEPPMYSEEKYNLSKIYHREVHESYFAYLAVGNALLSEDIPYTSTPPNHLPRQYGTYHQTYRLDGRLVALGVIDILPNCVSSVYFIYDPKWERFSLGKLSIFHEASLAREMYAAGAPGMQYLYLGLYVHSCPKMRYKGEYSPSYLADPEEYTWHPLEECISLLDRYRYASFAHPEHSIVGKYANSDEGEAYDEEEEYVELEDDSEVEDDEESEGIPQANSESE